ncbi:MAG TPA: four helix bundle protein [Thermoanaerobaculia bacterium]|nr:four helix bundle protein [Thermoanaerobaculia bacterium]
MSKSIYRDLEVWQKSRALASRVYQLTLSFPRSEMFGLTSQMRRASISVISNIAEGHGRKSIDDTIRFLVIARGSLLEIEAQTVVAIDLEYLESDTGEGLIAQTLEAVRLLNGLIRHYERKRP